jgi:hypothetical protein
MDIEEARKYVPGITPDELREFELYVQDVVKLAISVTREKKINKPLNHQD